MTRYEHTQIGHVIIWSLLAVILIVNGGLLGHHPPLLAASIILLVCLVLFTDSRLRSTTKPCVHHLDRALSAREFALRKLSDTSQFAFIGGMAGAFI